jgi:hypothetical protein
MYQSEGSEEEAEEYGGSSKANEDEVRFLYSRAK